MHSPYREREHPPARRLVLGGITAWLFLGSAPGQATIKLEGQTFAPTALISGQTLRLQGAGLRTMWFIKVYAAGLYTPQRADDATGALNMLGARRLQLRMLRQARPEDFIAALIDGLKENTDARALAAMQPRVARLEQTIRAIGRASEGDVIDFDFVPDRGTTVEVNGRVHGDPIPGADLFQAVLGIFLGERPVDARLKQKLLGQ